MSITEFTVKMMVLFLPGIISFIIIDNLTIHNPTKVSHRIIYSFILGFICYCPWTFICQIINLSYESTIMTNFTANLINDNQKINLYEVLIASIVAVIIGLLITKLIEMRIFYRISIMLGISRKESQADIWLNLLQEGGFAWVYLRDLENRRVYRGILEKSSDFTERDAIILSNVTVYDEKNGSELYHAPMVYLPINFEKIVIDFI